MKRLSDEEIVELNKKICKLDTDQGVFKEPNHIRNDIKDYVVYMRWLSAQKGGSCWDDENTVNEHHDYDSPPFHALEIVLEALGATYNQRMHIHALIESNYDTDYGYYGDYDTYTVYYVELEKIYKHLI